MQQCTAAYTQFTHKNKGDSSECTENREQPSPTEKSSTTTSYYVMQNDGAHYLVLPLLWLSWTKEHSAAQVNVSGTSLQVVLLELSQLFMM